MERGSREVLEVGSGTPSSSLPVCPTLALPADYRYVPLPSLRSLLLRFEAFTSAWKVERERKERWFSPAAFLIRAMVGQSDPFYSDLPLFVSDQNLAVMLQVVTIPLVVLGAMYIYERQVRWKLEVGKDFDWKHASVCADKRNVNEIEVQCT